ncbi:glycosyltransferase, partial [bacterium]|nr:glycosyltransferase [bacterium]
VLIESAVKVLEKHPKATFLIIGKEEEVKVAELQEVAASLGVAEAFHFTGKLDDPRQAMSALDIGLITSTESEVISRAAQEFFALGRPVIATKVNVLPEMIDEGANGLLVDAGDADQLADAILRLAGSDEERMMMGERARTYAQKRHDLSILGRATETFFKFLAGAFS